MADIMIPILRDTKDPHYRYKMPIITAKVEGSGNGIKTVITNMVAVARALGRPPSYPTKYFGCELGAQVTMNNDIYVVNGSHDAERLLSLLYGFIRKFVLCNKCNNPETTLTVVNQNIRQKCIACGHGTTISKAIHKLTTYIINHPPNETSPNGSSKSSKSEKKSKKNGTQVEVKVKGEEKNNDDFGADDFDDFDDDEFKNGAYEERLRELADGLSNAKLYSSDLKESANIFYEMVKQKKESNQLQDLLVHKELLKETEVLNIRDKSTLILSELLFTENILEEINTYRLLLLRFCNENRKSQKYLLGGIEKLIGIIYKDKLFNIAARIFKQLYDADIVDEETFFEWSLKPSKKYVDKETSKKIHEKVAPFIKWLKEAEVEEDDESEEEEKAVSAKPQQGQQQQSNGNGQMGQRKQSVEDEDEDDDDLFEFNHRVSGIRIETIAKPTPVAPVNGPIGGGVREEDDIDIDNI